MDEDVRQLLQERRYPQAIERLLDRYESRVFRLALMFLRNPARAGAGRDDEGVRIWIARKPRKEYWRRSWSLSGPTSARPWTITSQLAELAAVSLRFNACSMRGWLQPCRRRV